MFKDVTNVEFASFYISLSNDWEAHLFVTSEEHARVDKPAFGIILYLSWFVLFLWVECYSFGVDGLALALSSFDGWFLLVV